MFFKKHKLWLIPILTIFIAIPCALYAYIISGGLIARQVPPAAEIFLAHHILNLSVPAQARLLKSPLSGTEADVTAGRELYGQKCQVCHAYDGNGKADAGRGLPPAVAQRSENISQRTSVIVGRHASLHGMTPAGLGLDMVTNTLSHGRAIGGAPAIVGG